LIVAVNVVVDFILHPEGCRFLQPVFYINIAIGNLNRVVATLNSMVEFMGGRNPHTIDGRIAESRVIIVQGHISAPGIGLPYSR